MAALISLLVKGEETEAQRGPEHDYPGRMESEPWLPALVISVNALPRTVGRASEGEGSPGQGRRAGSIPQS